MLSNPANYLNAHLYSVCQRMDKVVLNTKKLPSILFKYGPKSIFLPKLSFEGQLDEIDKKQLYPLRTTAAVQEMHGKITFQFQILDPSCLQLCPAVQMCSSWPRPNRYPIYRISISARYQLFFPISDPTWSSFEYHRVLGIREDIN